MACKYCLDCTVDEELTPENDFSSFGIGVCDKNNRIMFSAGYGRLPFISFERYVKSKGWVEVGFYHPKYCPECGRQLAFPDNWLESGLKD